MKAEKEAQKAEEAKKAPAPAGKGGPAKPAPAARGGAAAGRGTPAARGAPAARGRGAATTPAVRGQQFISHLIISIQSNDKSQSVFDFFFNCMHNVF